MELSRPDYWRWVAFPFCRGSSQPRDGTQVSCIAGRFFTRHLTTGEDPHGKVALVGTGLACKSKLHELGGGPLLLNYE